MTTNSFLVNAHQTTITIHRHRLHPFIQPRVDFLYLFASVMTSAFPDDRLLPCRALCDKGVPCAVWFEDAIAHYGVPTVLFDLFVLVTDIELAAHELIELGWVPTLRPPKVGNATIQREMRSLVSAHTTGAKTLNEEIEDPNPPGSNGVVLLPAADWNYVLPDKIDISQGAMAFFPPLSGLLDALIDSMLDAPCNSTMLHIHLVCQISYLYEYVAALGKRNFAEKLKPEHRQYHIDVLAGMNTSSISFKEHERKIRDAIKDGAYELRDCSVSKDNEDFFTAGKEADILASMPAPVA